MGEGVFGLGPRLTGPRVGRGDSPGDRPPERQQHEEAACSERRSDEAVARILDAGPDPSEPEKDAEAQGHPSECPPRYEECCDGSPRDRQVIAEQARVDCLGEQRTHIQHEERARPVVEVAEGEVQEEGPYSGEDPQEQLRPTFRRVRPGRGPGDDDENADQHERHDRESSTEVGTEGVRGEPSVQMLDELGVHAPDCPSPGS
jgi:hypothetical protein